MPDPSPTDRAFQDFQRTADPQDLAKVFDATAAELMRVAVHLSRDVNDAEDLVQETLLKALRAADRFEPGSNLRAWLFTILHNTARNRARDRARDMVMVDSDVIDRASDVQPHGAAETPESLLLKGTLTPELQAAIDELPDVFRQAVWLRDVEEFSYAEIADILDIPAGTVMSRISRGRQLLFDRLQHLKPANA